MYINFIIGLIYLILKYYVDKYNIYNVHHPTSLRGRQTIHRTAVNFVMIGAFILQVCVLCYLVLRRGMHSCVTYSYIKIIRNPIVKVYTENFIY